MLKISRVHIVHLVALLLALPALNTVADPSMTWSLRNHYKIPIEDTIYIYAEDNAESRVLLDDGAVLFDQIGFSIELADGTVLNGENLTEGGPAGIPSRMWSVTAPPIPFALPRKMASK